MSRSVGQTENRASSTDPLHGSREEGTAARTRSFSFEEIMKRRKSKELSQGMKEEVKGAENILSNDAIIVSSSRPESLKGGRETKRLSSVIERPALENNTRVRSSSREEKSAQGTNGGASHDLKEPRYKEVHAFMNESTHVAGNRKNRESAAGLRTNIINESWSRDNRGETEKKIHSRSKNDDWHRGETEDRRLRRETRKAGYNDETKQKQISRGKNEERPRNYQEDRVQRNEPRNAMNKGETDKKVDSRSKNDERPRHSTVGRGQGNERSGPDKRIHEKTKGDERPRNDSDDRSRNAYARGSMVTDRNIGRSNMKLEKETKRKYQSADDKDIRDKNAAKKPDLGRSDSEGVEKKGQKQLSGSRHEETRMKRKRSRSQDRGRDRDRRSHSLSPHKVMSSHGKKPGDSSLHSHKDRPPKQHHKDVETSKFSSNGSGSHYRGHVGSTSGLGGYSPRKRKTENAVKTPPPANRSPERKSAGWDIPPSGVKDSSTASVTQALPIPNQQAMSLDVHELVSAVTAALNASKPLPGVSGFFPAKSNASIDSLQLTESTRPMRRLYIENVPGSASEKDIMDYLNNHLLSSGVNHIQGKQPCISCIIHKEKCQALVEFLTPQDASAALSFDGSYFSGCMLRIRRPKDFVEVATGVTVEAVKSAPIVPLSNVVKDSPHKVFIGGISDSLSAEMLIEIASAFGPLKAFYFEAKQDSMSQYAFLEYVDPLVTLKACAGLNGMKLGGQVLTAVQALPCTGTSEIFEKEPTYMIPDHAKPLLQKPTRVIKLKNVFTPVDMLSLSKSDIEEILEDLRLECTRFGTVKSLNVIEGDTLPVNNLEAAHRYHNDEQSAEAGENIGHGGKIYSETSGDVTDVGAEERAEVKTERVLDDKKERDEALDPDVTHTEAEELTEVEAERVVDDRKETDEALEPDSVSTEENMHDVSENEDDSSKQLEIKSALDDPTHSPSHGSHDQPSHFVDHIECPESKENATSQIKGDFDETNESASREEINMEEGKSSLKEASEDLSAAQDGETEEEEAERRRIFEIGSVFVEYKRTEGSCTAAHVLHGRLFDGRVVMVEYVPLEHYLAKFQR